MTAHVTVVGEAFRTGAFPSMLMVGIHRAMPGSLLLFPHILTQIDIDMHTKFLSLFCLCLLLSVAGCATGSDSSSGVNASPAGQAQVTEPEAPAGTRLGAHYMSALNEPCYEVHSADGSASTQALCLRKGSWELVPGIFMNVPKGQSQAAYAGGQPFSQTPHDGY